MSLSVEVGEKHMNGGKKMIGLHADCLLTNRNSCFVYIYF